MPDLFEFTRSSISTASLASLESLLNPPSQVEPMQKFLRFRLDQAQSALLAVEEIAAVQTIPISDVLPVPQMSACVLGMSNWRGESLWLVDLVQQIGLSTIADQTKRLTTLNIIIVQASGKSLGLAVPEIYELEEYNPQTLLNPAADLFSQQIFSLIKGYFKHDRSVVLDAAKVIQDPALHTHSFNLF